MKRIPCGGRRQTIKRSARNDAASSAAADFVASLGNGYRETLRRNLYREAKKGKGPIPHQRLKKILDSDQVLRRYVEEKVGRSLSDVDLEYCACWGQSIAAQLKAKQRDDGLSDAQIDNLLVGMLLSRVPAGRDCRDPYSPGPVGG